MSGRRPGRPSDGEHRPVVVSVPMTEDDVAWLDTQPGRSRADKVRRIVRDRRFGVVADDGRTIARIVGDPGEAPTNPGDAGDDTP